MVRAMAAAVHPPFEGWPDVFFGQLLGKNSETPTIFL
jgi:hypothetical protein